MKLPKRTIYDFPDRRVFKEYHLLIQKDKINKRQKTSFLTATAGSRVQSKSRRMNSFSSSIYNYKADDILDEIDESKPNKKIIDLSSIKLFASQSKLRESTLKKKRHSIRKERNQHSIKEEEFDNSDLLAHLKDRIIEDRICSDLKTKSFNAEWDVKLLKSQYKQDKVILERIKTKIPYQIKSIQGRLQDDSPRKRMNREIAITVILNSRVEEIAVNTINPQQLFWEIYEDLVKFETLIRIKSKVKQILYPFIEPDICIWHIMFNSEEILKKAENKTNLMKWVTDWVRSISETSGKIRGCLKSNAFNYDSKTTINFLPNVNTPGRHQYHNNRYLKDAKTTPRAGFNRQNISFNTFTASAMRRNHIFDYLTKEELLVVFKFKEILRAHLTAAKKKTTLECLDHFSVQYTTTSDNLNYMRESYISKSSRRLVKVNDKRFMMPITSHLAHNNRSASDRHKTEFMSAELTSLYTQMENASSQIHLIKESDV